MNALQRIALSLVDGLASTECCDAPLEVDPLAIEKTRLSHLEEIVHSHARQLQSIHGKFGRMKQLGQTPAIDQLALFGGRSPDTAAKLVETAIGRRLGRREKTILVALIETTT